MKKGKLLFLLLAIFGLFITPSKQISSGYAQLVATEAAKNVDNWILARTNFASTDEGLKFSQTEMGTPDNHAISILEVPFDSTAQFEITFNITMDEYVPSGRSANDVWAGIGIMGKPVFINWRNTDEETPSPLTGYGRAKDSPGLFTRFFNYSGDLRYEGSVYQENYHTLGEESTASDIVDTWRLYEGNASASIRDDITLKLSFDKVDNKEFYNVYINGNIITPLGEAAFIERDVIFPEGKIYLLLVMNTQEDDFNELSELKVKTINGYSYLGSGGGGTSEEPTSDNDSQTGDSQVTTTPGGDVEPPADNKKGCSGMVTSGTITLSTALISIVAALMYRRKRYNMEK
ncbi:MAG: hypothetical protein ACOX3C_02415 [Bacilli bacterium]